MPLLLVMTVGIYACIRFGADKDERENAKVGDCLSGSSAQEVKVVDCGDQARQWRVVGLIKDVDRSKYEEACNRFPEADTAFFETTFSTDVGYVLCLHAAKPTPSKSR
jgi:hypothetical protein